MLKQFAKYPYSRDAYKYASRIRVGHEPACQELRQACVRFLDDFQREAPFDYVYDVAKAEAACAFIEKLPHTKGVWAGRREKIKLEPWQRFIVCNLFGWVGDNGLRRFRECYAKIPRKNGKSLLAAAIALRLFVADDEFGAEVYSGATSEKQAFEVFKPARLICARTPSMCRKFGIEVHAKNLSVMSTGSKFEPLIGTPGDGGSPSCAVIDEYHEHASDDQVETMATGMGARQQPLLLKITTAGSSLSSPCYLAELDYRKVLSRVFIDERVFVVIFGSDDGDEWTDPAVLKKANPNYGVSVDAEFLLRQQQKAKQSARHQNAFRRKHLNQWTGAHTAFFNMDAWNKCADRTLDVLEHAGSVCVLSLDLASRIDLVASVKLFADMRDGKMHYTVYPKFYLPEATVAEDNNDHYQAWVNDGLIEETDGEEIDFNVIQTDAEAELAAYDLTEIVYDPWRATQLAQGITAKGATAIEWRNTVSAMSPAMYEIEAAVAAGRFHHPDHAVLNWMASNTVAKVDAKENVYPRKEKPENKIDGIVACIMGVGRLMVRKDITPPQIHVV